MNLCKNCEHWRTKQRDLNYSEFNGFCVNDAFAFNTNDGLLMAVFDTENIPKKFNPVHEIETNSKSLNQNKQRYLIVTDERFGCNKFKKI